MAQFVNLQPLEKVGRYTPLGIGFWDLAGGKPVRDGLQVSIRPAGWPSPESRSLRRQAFRTLSGVYAFQDLPGLRQLEASDPALPAGMHPLPPSPPQPQRFVVEVEDLLYRFMPVNFLVELPYRGLYPTTVPASPPGSGLPGFFLFSSPSRQTLTGLAVVRAQLVERVPAGGTRPAAHAVLEVAASRQPVWKGIADQRGVVLVAFPYPPFAAEVAPISPPPGPPETRVQAWDVTIRVLYRSTIGQSRPDSAARLPDLGAILTQPAAAFLPSPTASPQAQLNTRLVFGRPLLLRTAGTSELWIEP